MDIENPQNEALVKTSTPEDDQRNSQRFYLIETIISTFFVCALLVMAALVVYAVLPKSPNTCNEGDLDCLLWRTYKEPNVCHNMTLYMLAVQDGYKHYFAIGKCIRA